MDRLLVMRSFVTVAAVGSFAGAAKEMRTSPSMVSRHVADLEKKVGARLVNRTARSVSLTESGVRYHAFAKRIIDEIEEEDRSIAGLSDQVVGQLSVISPKWIGSLDLGDAIADFSLRYPEINLRFELGGLSERAYAFLDSGFDVAFQTRPVRDSLVRLRRVAELPFVLCAADAYLAAHGAPHVPSDLDDHDCLVHENELSWHFESEGRALVHRPRRSPFRTNSYLALHKATVRGRGIAMLPRRLAQEQLDRGELVALLDDLHTPDRSLFAVYGPSAHAPKKVEVLIDFLTRWFRVHCPASVSGIRRATIGG